MFEYRLPKNLYIMEDSNAWTFWTCQDSDNVVVFKRDQATGCDGQLQNMSTCDMQSFLGNAFQAFLRRQAPR